MAMNGKDNDKQQREAARRRGREIVAFSETSFGLGVANFFPKLLFDYRKAI